FDVNFSDPACPSGGDYLISVTPPPGGTYRPGPSQIIPPATDATTAAFSVPARTPGTIHHLHLRLDSSRTPGSSEIFNNHIPLDPQLAGSLAISKTTP